MTSTAEQIATLRRRAAGDNDYEAEKQANWLQRRVQPVYEAVATFDSVEDRGDVGRLQRALEHRGLGTGERFEWNRASGELTTRLSGTGPALLRLLLDMKNSAYQQLRFTGEVPPECTISTAGMRYDAARRELSCEASSVARVSELPVLNDDATRSTLLVRSHKTGKVVRFTFTGDARERGELVATRWHCSEERVDLLLWND